MRNKLIAAIVALCVILALAVAILIYLEASLGNDQPITTAPTVSVDNDAAIPSSTIQTDTTPSQSDTTIPPEATDAPKPNDEFIVTVETQPPQTEAGEQADSTEYTPPEGLDEDQTPII